MATTSNKKADTSTGEFILYMGMLVVSAVVVSIFVKNILLETRVIENFRRENTAYSIVDSINEVYYSNHKITLELNFPKNIHFSFDYSNDANSFIFTFADEQIIIPTLGKISNFNQGEEIKDPRDICILKEEEGVVILNKKC